MWEKERVRGKEVRDEKRDGKIEKDRSREIETENKRKRRGTRLIEESIIKEWEWKLNR